MVQELVVDEVFHVIQVQRFCKGSFEYDNKITTPPGLYLVTWLYYKVLNWFVNIECTLGFTRFTNVMYAVMMPFVIKQLLKDENVALELCLFPTSFFFHFLYYTDSGSVFWILFSLLEARRNRYTRAALYSFISICYRQTNVVWMLLIMGLSALQFYKRQATQITILDYVQFILHNPIMLLKNLWGFVINVILFAYFLYWNKGIVIGDKMNHTVGVHIPQIYYFSVFTLFFSWDYRLVFKAFRILRPPHLVVMIIIGWTIVQYTIEHPFLLADNRHFSFYIWRWFFKGSLTARLVVVPIYFLALRGLLYEMGKSMDIVSILGYSLAVVLSLIPSPLLEFRYFITPYYFYRILTFKDSKDSYGKILLNIIVNSIVFCIFFFKTFNVTTADGTIQQRFMW